MKRLRYLITIIPICFLCACAAKNLENSTASEKATTIHENSPKSLYQKISAEQAKAIMEEENPYILLDVRTDEEFSEKRIEGAILIPDYEIASRADEELPDKNTLILIYCRSGRRSAITALQMIEMGYTNVYDFGGIIDWPYETASD